MNTNSKHYFLMFLLLFVSCYRYPHGVEKSLKLAGGNRTELEKVLNHYRKNPSDSLKYKAACFLIESMPVHYSYSGIGIEEIRDTIRTFAMRHNYPVSGPHLRIVPTIHFEDKFTVPVFEDLEKVYDIHIMTAEYLIENIDLAFEAWLRAPWGNNIDFANFCEHILPYRTGNEPLRNWRRRYGETFSPILDSLLTNNDPVEAGKLLYDSICHTRWIFDNQVTPLFIDALHLLECRIGNCRLLADYATFAFRSVGIASGIDCNLQNPRMFYQFHYWNYQKDSTGKTVPFELYQTAVSHEPGKIGVAKGKVYREHYNKQKSSLPLRYKNANLPPTLDNAYLTDVSADYFEGVAIEYQIDRIEENDSLLYLGVFNNRTWIPIAATKNEDGKAIFLKTEHYYSIKFRPMPFICCVTIPEDVKNDLLHTKMVNRCGGKFN